MMDPSLDRLVSAIQAGDPVAHSTLAALDAAERERVSSSLVLTSAGRRWLRADPNLDATLADRLLDAEDDFRRPRRDHTLANVIWRASTGAIERRLHAIAAGPGAPALWQRLSSEPERLVEAASAIVAGDDPRAAEATLHLLVLDPLDPFRLGSSRRGEIAEDALASSNAEVRGLAAEFLAGHDPGILRQSLDLLQADDSERVRGIVWTAALQADRSGTVESAVGVLGDETAAVPIRRSALVALGTTLPTAQMVDLLTYFVVHPNHELASDAAGLLYNHHRNPLTAEAARDSPHADVREVAERLLDPLRGSPAAGGSRPGDPTRSSADIYAEMIQQLEEKAGNQNGAGER